MFLILCCFISITTQSIAQKQESFNVSPDKNTVYLDEAGKKITVTDFNTAISKGGFNATPIIKDGKIASLQKKKANGKKEESTVDGEKKMLSPDENTVYFDEDGKSITKMELFTKMQAGGYKFVPEVDNGKIKSLKLKKIAATLSVGTMAKDFTVTDLAGKKWSLSQLKGKTVVLNFWFTSCAPCIQEMPELNTLSDKYKKNENIVFLAITYDTKEVIEKFLSKREFKFNLVPKSIDVINEYGVSSYPTSLVIDGDGKIALSITAYNEQTVSKIEAEIEKLNKK